ncbi:hypothetical protein THAOC_33671 [Thalassiosira oceanica]|uniref:SUN domain-containing protein n=1 Tax=Thalassiosira oceanica TaxID=159749 RepID=K0RLL0_THAOC|nr:hypothetical protein THAOC_33671 [Thalassiosira oceanica]|mmetsp:Transcript_11083/g.25831  ORF Transcript_11083/g.25831 Transcript_11083/m.25831 type:complete len:882 (+) Transcript_11083:67-2712(+)|eukprot:EJK47597.1 hypothetical protein THAOC_33671 [Thalassiosira oceanica]
MKTPGKRKAATALDEAGSQQSSGEEEEQEVLLANGETPPHPSNGKTPGSSPGMIMRSGRKKKRGKRADEPTLKSGAANNVPRKRSKTTAEKDTSSTRQDNLETDETHAATTEKATNGAGILKTPRSPLDDDCQASDEELNGLDAAKTKQPDSEFATAHKVPPETVREAVAAAQVSDDTTPGDGENGADTKEREQINRNPLIQFMSQALRLPSQHTPKPPAAAETNVATSSAAAGGRRLVFATSTKKPSDGGVAKAKRNELLLRTRKQSSAGGRQSSTVQQPSETAAASSRSDDSDPNLSVTARQTSFYEILWDNVIGDAELKSEVLLYTKAWFGLLFILTIIGSAANVSFMPNIRQTGSKLLDYYGIDGDLTSAIEDEPDVITKTVVNPEQLQQVKDEIRAYRMNDHNIAKMKMSIDEMTGGVDSIESAINGLTDLPKDKVSSPVDLEHEYSVANQVKDSLAEKERSLLEWERGLAALEKKMDGLEQGTVSPEQVNDALDELARVSLVKAEAKALDVSQIVIPGDDCEGQDYTLLEAEEIITFEPGDVFEEEHDAETIEVIGAIAIDVEALDYASDAPVRMEDAQIAFENLVHYAQSTSESSFHTERGPSPQVKRWLEEIINAEIQKEAANELPPVDRGGPLVTGGDSAATESDPITLDSYSVRDAFVDIDRLLEVEDADRTGQYDHASVYNGARVLRRGPQATSYSLYETLPLFNRVLAYLRLRFYGHPPEVALRPSTMLHGRGQCWSFPDEFQAAHARKADSASGEDNRGEYATLTVNLASSISVSEVIIEHVPLTISSNPNTAIKDFRIVGYEDGGAFGEAWELGTFRFLNGPNFQTFSIPSSLDGTEVPKLRSISLAVDSNYGADYSCLYRLRVHGS